MAGFVIALFALHEGREAWEGELVEDHADGSKEERGLLIRTANLNLPAAFLEVLNEALGSVAMIVACHRHPTAGTGLESRPT